MQNAWEFPCVANAVKHHIMLLNFQQQIIRLIFLGRKRWFNEIY